jgi:phenylalanyl-tRNA synthetase beta chain
VDVARHNVELGNERVGLWEIARVYLPREGEKLPEERIHVAAVLEGDFFRAKGAVEALHAALKVDARYDRGEHPFFHPGKTARVDAGVLGELHPRVLAGRWGAFELDLHRLAEDARDPVEYHDVVSFPVVKQDLAFVVDEELPAADLVDAVREAGGAEVRDVRVFDVYHGDQVDEGRKSVALHVAFQSPERTLSDEDAAELRERIVAALGERYRAVLRA